jgi:NADP-dependent 3-hydroxy acid dehydrogenase YdfG
VSGFAWVTGAGSGIGRAVAIALAKAGWRLALTGRREEALRETAAMLGGAEALILPADLTDSAAVEAVVAKLPEAPALLVNNAGANTPQRHWHHISAANARALVDANLTAPFLTSLAVLPGMKQRGGGLIVQIASVAGKGASPVSGPAYIAAKTGFVALSASLNAENGIHGIRSTCICPGEVATPILDLRPKPPSAEERATMLQPEDVAAAVLFATTMPAHVCLNEIVITPTHNREHAAGAKAVSSLA